MRVVLDTNVLISALLVAASPSAQLLNHWRQGRYDLLTAEPQIEELRRVSRYPRIRERLKPALAGRLINELRELAMMVTELPLVEVSRDPYDNYLLSIAQSGRADYLISGDKRDLLSLYQHAGTQIRSVRGFLTKF
jgi:uncharacterized protein